MPPHQGLRSSGGITCRQPGPAPAPPPTQRSCPAHQRLQAPTAGRRRAGVLPGRRCCSPAGKWVQGAGRQRQLWLRGRQQHCAEAWLCRECQLPAALQITPMRLTACLEVGVAGSKEDHPRNRRRHWELQRRGDREAGKAPSGGAMHCRRENLRSGPRIRSGASIFAPCHAPSTAHPEPRHQEADDEGGRHLQGVLVALRSTDSVHSAARRQLLVVDAWRAP